MSAGNVAPAHRLELLNPVHNKYIKKRTTTIILITIIENKAIAPRCIAGQLRGVLPTSVNGSVHGSEGSNF